jgi:PAS domain-containing protein
MSSIVGKTPASSSWSTGNPSFDGKLTLGLQRPSGRVDFSDLFGDAKLICVTLDTGCHVTYCNDYLLHLTGWERSDVIGQDWFAFFLPRKLTT